MLLIFNNYMRKVQTILLLLLLPFMVVMAENNLNNDVSGAPLYVVDGVVQTELTNIPKPEEIYSVTILKDETAIQLYGERGKNGVIDVTTKKSLGDAAVSMRSEQTSQTRSYKTYDPTKDKKPLYIVDGYIGVHPDDLPSKEEIAETNELPRATAMDIYGKRATYGAVIIKTKEFVKTHGGNGTRYDNSDTPKQHKKGTPGKLGRWIKKVTGGNTFLGIILSIIIVLAIMTLPTIVSRKLRKKNSKKSNKRAFSNYDPGIFDPEGVRFEAAKQLKNYFLPIFCLFIITMCGIILYRAITGTPSIGLLLIILIFLGGLAVLFILAFVNSCKRLRSYLIIDEKGIRGCVLNTERLNLNLDLKEIDISWEQIKRAQMDGDLVTFFKIGTKIPDDMVDFAELADIDITEEEIENSIYQIDLSMFPVNKVRDCINYFYARKMDIKKQPALIKPQSLEERGYLEIIFVIIVAILLTFLMK